MYVPLPWLPKDNWPVKEPLKKKKSVRLRGGVRFCCFFATRSKVHTRTQFIHCACFGVNTFPPKRSVKMMELQWHTCSWHLTAEDAALSTSKGDDGFPEWFLAKRWVQVAFVKCQKGWSAAPPAGLRLFQLDDTVIVFTLCTAAVGRCRMEIWHPADNSRLSIFPVCRGSAAIMPSLFNYVKNPLYFFFSFIALLQYPQEIKSNHAGKHIHIRPWLLCSFLFFFLFFFRGSGWRNTHTHARARLVIREQVFVFTAKLNTANSRT